jgi:CreA protein
MLLSCSGSRRLLRAALLLLATVASTGTSAEEIGHVDTVWKMIGPDHKIKIEAFDDEKVSGVTCHVSRAVTGGIKGAIGVAEDTSDASLSCRQVGPVSFTGELKYGEEVFKERRSMIFKSLQVVRFCDETRNTLVYLVYSDEVIEGSPKNAISSVPLTVWEGGEPPPRCNDGAD